VRGNNVSALSLFIAHGADIHQRIYGNTPLECAAFNGHAEAVALLLDHGATFDLANEKGETLLHYAARQGRQTVIQLLIGRGYDMNAVNHAGQTPLAVAAHMLLDPRVFPFGHPDQVIRVLIDAGAHVNENNPLEVQAVEQVVNGGPRRPRLPVARLVPPVTVPHVEDALRGLSIASRLDHQLSPPAL
jgi:ankyrin repeat protein